MEHTLANLNHQRLNWAYQAKRDFINHFQKLDAKNLETKNSKELTISVYGPTQVGKTTLILTILGIRKDKIKLLSKWLRGNRKLGESATVTVMRYEQSQDNYFHLIAPDGKSKSNISGEELEQALESLRMAIENQEATSVEPFLIQVPSDYFEDNSIRLNIIDLPGVESAEQKEVLHVEQCVKYWLPLSEVCLLVDDGGQLTSFTQYQLKEIKDWVRQPDHFRIIPTRAVSLDSVQKKVQSGIIKTSEDLISDYVTILMRVLGVQDDDTESKQVLKKIIYPVDFGNSWTVLNQNNPDIYLSAKEIMQDILTELRRDLVSINVNDISFSRLTHLYHVAEKESAIDLNVKKKNLEKVEKQIKYHDVVSELKRNQIEKEIKEVGYKFDQCIEFLSNLSEKENEICNNFMKKNLDNYKSIKDSNLDKKASSINNAISQLQLQIISNLESEEKKMASDALRLDINFRTSKIKDIPTIPVIEKSIDTYIFQKSYLNAISKTNEYVGKWLDDISYTYLKMIKDNAEKVSRLRDNLGRKLDRLKSESQSAANQTSNKKAKLQSELELIQADAEISRKIWQQDLHHAKELQKYFMAYWLNYKDELIGMVTSGSYVQRWSAIYYLQILMQDGEKIINSLAMRGETQ